MSNTPKDPQLGDTLGTGRAGRVDPEVGASQGGPSTHERASFSDPITLSESDASTTADRVPGAASTTPDASERGERGWAGAGGDMEERAAAANLGRASEAPMRGAGTPVRRGGDAAHVGDSPDVSGVHPERELHSRSALTEQAQTSQGDRMDRNDRDRLDAVDASGKGPKTNDIIHHDDHPGVGDHIGEAAGGISGVLTGAAIGSAGGPIGTIIGGIAGAIGGWWSGRAISEAATRFTHSDDDYYRNHYETSSTRLADRKYEDVRPAYQIGHLAAHNPDYADREWDAVEADLQRGWSDDLRTKHGDWQQVRGYARDAYTRGRTSRVAGGVGATAGAVGHSLADRVDDLKDRVDGNPASRPGADATDSARRQGAVGGMSASGTDTSAGYGAAGTVGSLGDRAANTADRVGDKAENLWDRTKQGAENLGHKVADKADDLKDRVDGDPASRPGPDATDRRF